MAWIWVIKHISKFITQLFAKDFVFPLSYGFVWFHMEQNWALTYSSEMQVVENYVSFFGRYPSRNFEPPFKKTNCGPLHTIKPQTFSICTVLDGFLAWVPLTLMNIRYSETTFVTQRKVEMTISWFLHTTLIEIS